MLFQLLENYRECTVVDVPREQCSEDASQKLSNILLLFRSRDEAENYKFNPTLTKVTDKKLGTIFIDSCRRHLESSSSGHTNIEDDVLAYVERTGEVFEIRYSMSGLTGSKSQDRARTCEPFLGRCLTQEFLRLDDKEKRNQIEFVSDLSVVSFGQEIMSDTCLTDGEADFFNSLLEHGLASVRKNNLATGEYPVYTFKSSVLSEFPRSQRKLSRLSRL